MYELLESQKRVIQLLTSIGNRHPNDVETQRSVAQANGEIAMQALKLNELLGYADPKSKDEIVDE